MQEYTEMRIPEKRYRTNTVRTFWDTPSTSALRPLVSTISLGSVRKCEKYKWDYGIRNFSLLDKLVRFCICSQHRVFPLPWWYFPIQVEIFRQSGKFVLYYYEKKWKYLAGAVMVCLTKKLEEVHFVDEEFLHKKVNRNGVYMRIMVCYRRYSRRHG